MTPAECLVEECLDVDLLLDRVGHLGHDRGLHLGIVDERADRVDVALTVVEGALAPVGERRRDASRRWPGRCRWPRRCSSTPDAADAGGSGALDGAAC